MWKEAIINIPGIGMDLDNPTTKANIKNENESRTQEEKDTKDKERAERLEERKKKDEEMRKQYELTMPREEQKIDVEPIDTENDDILESDTISSINPSTYPVMSKDTINDINTSQPQQETPQLPKENPNKRDITMLTNELNELIVNRLYEIFNIYVSTIRVNSSIYLKFGNGETMDIIEHKETTKDIDTLCDKVRAALRTNKNIEILHMFKSNKHYQTIKLGNFETDAMKSLINKIIKLGGSIFSKIKNTFKAPDEIKETKMKLSELSERTIENNKSLRELEKTIEELTNRVNELSKQVGKSYVDRKINKPSFLKDITKPQILKPVKKEEKELPEDNPDSMESQLRRKMEERRKDLEPSEESEEDEDWGGKIKIESSDAKKPIPMSDFFKKYL
jgi:dephospho-CoA kinase